LRFVLLDLVSPVQCQQIGWEERLRNDLFCVEWDVKPWSSQSIQFCLTGLLFWSYFKWGLIIQKMNL